MDTRAFEHFRTRADAITYNPKLGITQITDTTYFTEHSLNENNPPPLSDRFRPVAPSTDERNRYLYHTNLAGLPGQSGSPLFRVIYDKDGEDPTIEIIGVASLAPVASYDPPTRNITLVLVGTVIPYNPGIELDEENPENFRVNLESTIFALVNSKINYPNLEKTIQDTINKENQNSE